jgi:membrane protein YdbS with pleckstrin-like domain
VTSRRRRERDALGGTLDPYYSRPAPDPYTGHLPEQLRDSESSGFEPAAGKTGFRNRLGGWRKAWLPLPDEIIKDYLGDGEEEIYNDHPSFRAFVVEHIILVLLLFIAAGLFVGVVLNGSTTAILLTFLLLAIVLLVLVLIRLSERYTSYVITNVRIMRVAGILTRRVHSIPWMRVTDLTYEQSPLGRILKYATLHIESANEDSGLRDLAGVSNPLDFNKYLVGMVVAKQGPTQPEWEKRGLEGPAGLVASQQRIGLSDRVREIRRRRRQRRATEAGLEVPTARRRAAGAGAAPPAAPEGAEPILYGDPRRMRDDGRTSQPEVGEEKSGGADREDARERGRRDDSSVSEGVDPLREGPESSVPWGRDRE